MVIRSLRLALIGLIGISITIWIYTVDISSDMSLWKEPKNFADAQTIHTTTQIQLPSTNQSISPLSFSRIAPLDYGDSRWHINGTRWTGNCARFRCWKDDDPQLAPRCQNPDDPIDYSRVDGYPPCCSHILRKMLDDFGYFLQATEKSYFLHYATLLGAKRNASLIPWLLDVDLGMLPKEFFHILGHNEMRSWLYQQGYSIFKDARTEMGHICINHNFEKGKLALFPKSLPQQAAYVNEFPTIKIYLWQQSSANQIFTTTHGPCRFLSKWVFPLGELSIGNKKYPAPNDHQKMVEHIYGPTLWRQPSQGPKAKWVCAYPLV